MSNEKNSIIETNRRYVCPDKIRIFGEIGIDLIIGKREGTYIFDVDGKKLIDLHINGGTYNLGHQNPEVIKALQEALDMGLDIGNHHFPSEQRGLLAEKLVKLTPGDMKSVVLTSGGSESVDVAIKSARHATKRKKIVSIDYGFHGRTGLSGSVGDTKNAEFFLSDTPEISVRVFDSESRLRIIRCFFLPRAYLDRITTLNRMGFRRKYRTLLVSSEATFILCKPRIIDIMTYMASVQT